jgi:hypothetical protein
MPFVLASVSFKSISLLSPSHLNNWTLFAHYARACVQALALPPDAQADVDLQSVIIRGRPFADAEELAPACHRCGATNPIVGPQARTGMDQVSGFTSNVLQ